MSYRQSDGRIVPVKAGNAAGGKSREDCIPRSPAIQSNIFEETLSIHRDGINNGNDIGENIATIERKSKHSIHVHWASDQ